MNVFGGAAELALYPFVGFEVFAEAQIFGAVFFAKAADLNQVGDQISLSDEDVESGSKLIFTPR